MTSADEEAFDLVEHGILISCPRCVVTPRQFDESSSRDPGSDIATRLHELDRVIDPVDHERRRADRRKDGPKSMSCQMRSIASAELGLADCRMNRAHQFVCRSSPASEGWNQGTISSAYARVPQPAARPL